MWQLGIKKINLDTLWIIKRKFNLPFFKKKKYFGFLVFLEHMSINTLTLWDDCGNSERISCLTNQLKIFQLVNIYLWYKYYVFLKQIIIFYHIESAIRFYNEPIMCWLSKNKVSLKHFLNKKFQIQI